MKDNTYWTQDRIMKLIIGCAIAVALIFLIKYLRNVLLPFFAALLISYLLNPLVKLNKRILRLKGRGIPTLLTLVDVGVLIFGVVYLFLPSTIDQLNHLGDLLEQYSHTAGDIASLPPEIHRFLRDNFDIASYSDILKNIHLPSIMAQGSSMVSYTLHFLMQTLEWALMFIYIIFILIDYDQIARGVQLLFPARHRSKGMEVINDVKMSMNHYFRGQGLVALGAMILYCTGFSIVGIPLAIPLGLMVGVLYMIPYFQYITIIPVTAVCFLYSLSGEVHFWGTLGYCGLVYVVSQSICDYILTPHIMGKELGMNPAIILLSLSIWGSLLGIIGMIIALPATSLIMSYYERYISNAGTPAGTPAKN